ncbi:TetR/AcrR family transcriptional regulator [Roseovarius sp. LXJ103]|uniref:TetR/AcrR family transcriptional regulator n=1 Tax=Roseovarius carneus TaxID=2853164 RepID=UPI000D61A481|nr:TetR/AcrR family transcriptional regulator [Roseovarius carneus]MBZ8118629.1 TetR/AcrR family transcriptional regulator [Roseovarius carneus]PWE35686.1 TetR family transcriptional regulator [Pelagicola sp. LXJ1103]
MSTTTDRPRKERKANADKRRQQLLDAALRSIAANGLSRTTLATVANEAGLSQGVAVFYFKSKAGLLAAALAEHYAAYQRTWEHAITSAGDDPLDQIVSLIRADFSPRVCNPQALAVWFAFWGEQKFTPQYADVSAEFDTNRAAAVRQICAKLMPDAPEAEIAEVAEWIDTISDGYWQHLHVSPASVTRESAHHATLALVCRLIPAQADAIRARAQGTS